VIPARAGSGRLYKKNLRRIGGASLVEWAIRCSVATARALNRGSGCKATVILVSNSGAAHAIATRWGKDVERIREPAELAREDVSDLPVARYATRGKGGVDDAVVWMRPTAPFRSPRVILEAIQRLYETNVQAVRSVRPAMEHPFKSYVETYRHGQPEDIYLVPTLVMRAANHPFHGLPRAWVPTGLVDVFRYGAILGSSARSLDGEWAVLAMPDSGSHLDIDTSSDLTAADWMARAQRLGPFGEPWWAMGGPSLV